MIKLDPNIPSSALKWRNDPQIYRWCRQYEPITEEHHKKWLESIQDDPKIKMYGIDSEGAYVGVCGFTGIDWINRSAEFSLYIAPDYQRQGHGTEALKELIKHGFETLNLNRIWGEVFEDNPALSIDLKLGFQEEGLLRETYYRNGKYINTHIISLLKKDYFSGLYGTIGGT
jgi:UDP-4-amino-4,6-dideoxy-N-acetyl-beta-L-altrosamine N-acetyltransferase